MMIKAPTEIIVELKKYNCSSFGQLNQQLKNETISSDFKDGGLKNVDINKKIASVQCSWIKRLYHDKMEINFPKTY